MKKLLSLLASVVLLAPFTAYAIPVTWDYGSSVLQPLSAQSAAQIKGSYFTATSTTASTFPNASSTAISATVFCFIGDSCRTTWPTAGVAWPFTTTNTNFGVAVQSTSTPEWFTAGMQASSTSQFVNANIWGNLTLKGTNSALLSTDSSGNVAATSSVGANYITGALGTITTNSPLGGGGTFSRGGTLTLTCTTCNTSNASVSSIGTTWPIKGGTITTTGTITWGGLATTSQPSSSNLLVSNGGTGIFGVATSTLTPSSPLTGSLVQIGSGGSLGCQTASGSQAGCLSSSDWTTFNSKGSGTVTSIVGGTGLNGGTITTSGTLSLKSYIGTSTADVAGQVLYWATSNGTPANVTSSSAFSFANSILTVTNASTTNLTAANDLFVNGNSVTGYRLLSNKLATTTPWTASSSPLSGFGDTMYVNSAYKAFTVTAFSASTTAGTLELQFVCGSNSFYYPASTTGSTYTENTSCSAGQPFYLIGGNPASSPVNVPFTIVVTGF